MKRRRRVGLALLLLAAIAALLVVHAATADERWPYPTGEDLKSDYETHVGEETLLFAGVERIEAGQLWIESDGTTYRVYLPRDQWGLSVRPGGIVQVFGTIAPDGVIDANRVVVVSATEGAEGRKLALSVVGALLFLVVFFRYWRVNPRHLKVEVREDG